jgi:ATP-dependent Clp protease ATP-binding subunit ClpC
MKEMLNKEVERHFRPEFLNRLDDVIVFKALSREDLVTIVDYELRKVRGRLGEHGLELELTEESRQFLIDKGFNPDFGARPLRRAIEHYVEDPISEDILRGTYKDKSKVVVSVKGEGDEKHLYFEGVGKVQPTEQKLQEVHEGT